MDLEYFISLLKKGDLYDYYCPMLDRYFEFLLKSPHSTRSEKLSIIPIVSINAIAINLGLMFHLNLCSCNISFFLHDLVCNEEFCGT